MKTFQHSQGIWRDDPLAGIRISGNFEENSVRHVRFRRRRRARFGSLVLQIACRALAGNELIDRPFDLL
ncbi:MAG TPA: hypothetical protein VHX61_12115 [Rhizomicrobium sp.]|nr:hypothetical protein [Rhizomicrobium sp.]